MGEQYVLGIDAGTSSAKVGLVASDGTLVRVVSESYPMSSPHPGWTEQDADDWWSAARRAVRQALQGVDPRQVLGIGLSNAGGSMVALDAQGRPVRPAFVWLDSRSTGVAERMIADLGHDFWVSHLGHASLGFSMLAKLVWLREYEPAVYARIAKVCQPSDYMVYRLTGEAVTDRSTACATGVYNLLSGKFDPAILAATRIPPEMLPRLEHSGTVAGHVSAEAAAELGLMAGTPVVLGAWDQVCAVVGAGSESGQDALLSAGTAWTLAIPTAQVRIADSRARVWTVQHARRGQTVLMIAMSNGGACVEWYRRAFPASQGEQEGGEDEHGALRGLPKGVARIPPGSNGVLFLPHLIGAAGIHNEPEYSGCILGLKHGTGQAEVFRAVLEGVAYEVRWSLETLREIGVRTPALRLVGGATRSPIWSQIVADVTGLEVRIPAQTECAVLGAARLAQEAVGVAQGTSAETAHIARSFPPQAEAVAAYERYYPVYKLAHIALKETLGRLKAAGTAGS
jgi:xylulokinase